MEEGLEYLLVRRGGGIWRRPRAVATESETENEDKESEVRSSK